MGNGCACKIDALHLATRPICPFTDAVGDTTRLANANADTSITIANHYHGTEGEAATTLDHLGDALDVDNALVKFLAFFTLAWFTSFTRCAFFALLFAFHAYTLRLRILSRLRVRLQQALRHDHDTCNRPGQIRPC